jgi:hypothetical protein
LKIIHFMHLRRRYSVRQGHSNKENAQDGLEASFIPGKPAHPLYRAIDHKLQNALSR